MYCQNCGEKLNDDQLICPRCGQKMDPAVQESVIRHINEKQAASAEISAASLSMHDPGQSQYIPQGNNVMPGSDPSQGINQTPGNNMIQRPNVNPGMNMGDPSRMDAARGDGSSGESKKRADMLCIISLGMMFLSALMPFLLGFVDTDSGSKVLTNIIVDALGFLSLVSIAIMIFVRIKYPKNTFGKLLMWIYIVLVALSVLVLIAIIATCYYIISTCPQ